MFSFHRPKVYRSSTGCCICKAKSSSSRFTDSKKYEDDFMPCFLLEERRSGEICNACVLLVKRFKKLPPDSERNWSHVVDARAGPGIKSTKFKAKNKRRLKDKPEKLIKKKHIYVKSEADREQSPAMSDDLNDDYRLTDSKASSRSESASDDDDIGINEKQMDITPEDQDIEDDGFFNLSYYKREVTCCGNIFRGPNGEVMLYLPFLKPCMSCLARRQLVTSLPSTSPIHSSASVSPAYSVESTSSNSEPTSKQSAKSFSDASSDSGYDESSNQDENKIAKSILAKEDVEMIVDAPRPLELDQLSSYESLQVVNIANHSLHSN